MNHQERRLAIFDFDGTIAPGDSIVPYIRFAAKFGHLKLIHLFQIIFALCLSPLPFFGVCKAKTLALSFLKNMSADEVDALNDRFIHERVLPSIYQDAHHQLNEHRKNGDIILIVSASPDSYMRYLKNRLPVDDILATLADQTGTIRVNCRGAEKVNRTLEWLKENRISPLWAESFAYGNTTGDIAVMELTGHPVCINPSQKLIKSRPGWSRAEWK